MPQLKTRLDAGSPAFRLSVLSATLAAAAACLALRLWKVAGPGGTLAGLAFVFACATDRALWGQATLGKGAVYGLNLCLTLAVLSSLAGRGRTAAAGGGLALGLACANHWMSAAGLVPLLFARLSVLRDAEHPRARPGRDLSMAGCMALAALSAYLWLPLRAAAGPALNWGEPSGLAGFLFSVGRLQYIGGLAESGVMPAGERLGVLAGAPRRGHRPRLRSQPHRVSPPLGQPGLDAHEQLLPQLRPDPGTV